MVSVCSSFRLLDIAETFGGRPALSNVSRNQGRPLDCQKKDVSPDVKNVTWKQLSFSIDQFPSSKAGLSHPSSFELGTGVTDLIFGTIHQSSFFLLCIFGLQFNVISKTYVARIGKEREAVAVGGGAYGVEGLN